MQTTPNPTAASGPTQQTLYSRRYVLYAIGLVFGVSVFNVVDRYILSILADDIKFDLGLSDTQTGSAREPVTLGALPPCYLAR